MAALFNAENLRCFRPLTNFKSQYKNVYHKITITTETLFLKVKEKSMCLTECESTYGMGLWRLRALRQEVSFDALVKVLRTRFDVHCAGF